MVAIIKCVSFVNLAEKALFSFDNPVQFDYYACVLTHIVHLVRGKNKRFPKTTVANETVKEQDIWRVKNMKKSIILFAMVVMSVFFFTACGPKVASSGNVASYGNVASGGNVASASNAG